MKDLYSITK